MLGLAGIRYLVSCSLPSLEQLGLEHESQASQEAGPSMPASQCLSRGNWPALEKLFLDGNLNDTCAVLYLIQGNWPLLDYMTLSAQGVDEEACLLLGIAKADRHVVISNDQQVDVLKSKLFKSHLSRFPCLKFSFFC